MDDRALRTYKHAQEEYWAAELIFDQLPTAHRLAVPHVARCWMLLSPLCSDLLLAAGNGDSKSQKRVRELCEKGAARLADCVAAAERDDGRPEFPSPELAATLTLLEELLSRARSLLPRPAVDPFYRCRWFYIPLALAIAGLALYFALRPVPTFRVLSYSQSWGKLRPDESVLQQPLMIAGRRYATGFGTHADSTILLELTRAGRRLSGACGVDDETEGRGSITCAVRIDGQVKFQSGLLKGGLPAEKFDVDVQGGAVVQLEVTDAGDSPEWDHADWVDLTLAP